MAFNIKQNDTSPALRATLKDGSDNIINLTGASVKFHMKPVGGDVVKTNSTANVIIPAANGIVQYNWSSSDTDTAGSFLAEFEVTHVDGTTETFPNNGFVRIDIEDDLA